MAFPFPSFSPGQCLPSLQVLASPSSTRGTILSSRICSNTWWQQWVARKEWRSRYSVFKYRIVLANDLKLLSFPYTFVPSSRMCISTFFVCIFATPGLMYECFLRAFYPTYVHVSHDFLPTVQIAHRTCMIFRSILMLLTCSAVWWTPQAHACLCNFSYYIWCQSGDEEGKLKPTMKCRGKGLPCYDGMSCPCFSSPRWGISFQALPQALTAVCLLAL